MASASSSAEWVAKVLSERTGFTVVAHLRDGYCEFTGFGSEALRLQFGELRLIGSRRAAERACLCAGCKLALCGKRFGEFGNWHRDCWDMLMKEAGSRWVAADILARCDLLAAHLDEWRPLCAPHEFVLSSPPSYSESYSVSLDSGGIVFGFHVESIGSAMAEMDRLLTAHFGVTKKMTTAQKEWSKMGAESREKSLFIGEVTVPAFVRDRIGRQELQVVHSRPVDDDAYKELVERYQNSMYQTLLPPELMKPIKITDREILGISEMARLGREKFVTAQLDQWEAVDGVRLPREVAERRVDSLVAELGEMMKLHCAVCDGWETTADRGGKPRVPERKQPW